ncbi:Glutamyl-tRNA synthetase [Elusimicrobium minutum Pei191]|uniref:Glutamate--tRNA ligase n=1 Tax=Elusimicrobium minutum (strain Pei191) TaxID=445932 RepID=SYE_ELUMP|nr:glutamate--tRNA ligase [Elusimicrobium minutum]B2KAV3.1 RecName: Full=Glutamate--tRNA ligase; AltName: Full=Glutamyl-tRNA synthetase; Short=GluRS [Elusimicrobium minutum Pei191]ACC97649.1 Glutamyl-tRNA synthetase [Elusimicrobium minutum Pei191]
MKIRVRFAPSPTGFLHIGGVRTALFNYLFAKRYGGTFVLRIEDTDELRSTEESTQAIFDGLEWTKLLWDEGPFRDGKENGPYPPYLQSERVKAGIYQKYIDQLLEEGKAYKCYCTPEELEAMREEAAAKKLPPRYPGKCKHLTKDEQAALEAQGRKPVIRFNMPSEGSVEWADLIRGPVSFASKDLYDLVISKPSGFPTYNFACVIDDHLMEMSHIIRGEDHISNTPMQIQMYKAFGWTPPEFGHLPMIHGSDGTKLSKRHGATNVIEYQKQGYLSEALVNYLALLGWSNSESQQLFAPGELEQKFDIKGVQKSPAIFDNAKLDWMNSEYIRATPISKLTDLAIPFIKEENIDISKTDRAALENIIAIEQEKYRTLKEIPGLIKFFFEDVVFEEGAKEKVYGKPESKDVLLGITRVYQNIEPFKEADLEAATRAFAKDNGFKTGQIFHPVRVAVSGRTHGPTLFKMLELLGKETVIKRLNEAAKYSNI